MSKILEPSGYILYRVAEDNGFNDRYSIALNDLTRISGPARKIVMLAAECITGPDRSIHLHTGIPDQKDLKKSLGKLKSIVKFSANGAALNEEKIDTLKRLAGGSSLSPIPISLKVKWYRHTRNSGRLSVPPGV